MKSFFSLNRFALALTACLLAASPTLAQEAGPEEGIAYQAWHAANAENQQEKASELAKAYLASYPTGQYAAYLKSWLHALKLQTFTASVQAKNTDDMIKVGREILAADPENLGVTYSLAFNLRRLELAAAPPNFAHSKEAVEFAQSGIKLIEAGKTIEGGRFDKDASLALLYQIQAIAANNEKKTDQAIEFYTKSNAADPDNLGIVANNLLALASLHLEPYSAAVAVYQAFPEADRTAAELSPEVKAALDTVYAKADPLIDAWTRFVALARARNVAADTRDQVLASVKTVYSTRHAGDTTGLEPLLEKLQAEYTPKS